MTKGSCRNNNKNRKGKGNDSKPNQTTNAKQELKFAPVGRNGNFAPYNTVKEAYILEVQSKAYKAMVPLIDSIRNEKEPDWDSMKPEKEYVSFDPDIKSIRKETMEVRLVREQLESQQGNASVPASGSQEERMVNMVQKTCDDEWQLQCDAWMTSQKECQNEVASCSEHSCPVQGWD